jgi:hypothetical protein
MASTSVEGPFGGVAMREPSLCRRAYRDTAGRVKGAPGVLERWSAAPSADGLSRGVGEHPG